MRNSKMKAFFSFILLLIANKIHCRYVSPNQAIENEDLFEGDIAGIDPNNHNAVVKKKSLWTNGIIYYQIDPSLDHIRNLIKEAIDQYESKTCLRFVQSKGNGNYLNIKSHTGCYSYVGMVGDVQDLSLADGCHNVGTIVHEIGHAVGLNHEQNRSDRDQYLKIHWENVSEEKKHNFKKLKPEQNHLMTVYDYDSIMQYGAYVFSKNGLPTMEVLIKGKTIKGAFEKEGLSSLDVFIVNSLYSCQGFTRPPPIEVPDYKCGFEDEKCNFRNDRDYTKAKIVSEGGNRYLKADQGNKEYMFLTPFYKGESDPVCLRFRYKIEGTLLQNVNVEAHNSGYHESKMISSQGTNEWKNFQMQITPPSFYMFYIDVITDQGSTFGIDDIHISYKSCD